MIIEKLINSKTQTVIFFFIVSIIYLLLPLLKLLELNSETIKIFNLIFSSATLFFSSLYLTNIIFEKSIIRKNNIVIPVVFLALCMPLFEFNFLMIRRPPRSTPKPSSAASDVYKRQAVIELHN